MKSTEENKFNFNTECKSDHSFISKQWKNRIKTAIGTTLILTACYQTPKVLAEQVNSFKEMVQSEADHKVDQIIEHAPLHNNVSSDYVVGIVNNGPTPTYQIGYVINDHDNKQVITRKTIDKDCLDRCLIFNKDGQILGEAKAIENEDKNLSLTVTPINEAFKNISGIKINEKILSDISKIKVNQNIHDLFDSSPNEESNIHKKENTPY